MSSQSQTAKYMPRGLNDENFVLVSAVLTSALTAAQTLTLTLPDNVSDDLVPIFVKAYNSATPAVELSGPAQANLDITSHNRDTGVTVLTAAGAGIATAARVIVGYGPLPA